jgi:hypothetical protein
VGIQLIVFSDAWSMGKQPSSGWRTEFFIVGEWHVLFQIIINTSVASSITGSINGLVTSSFALGKAIGTMRYFFVNELYA